jgi:hypothetical protein
MSRLRANIELGQSGSILPAVLLFCGKAAAKLQRVRGI